MAVVPGIASQLLPARQLKFQKEQAAEQRKFALSQRAWQERMAGEQFNRQLLGNLFGGLINLGVQAAARRVPSADAEARLKAQEAQRDLQMGVSAAKMGVPPQGLMAAGAQLQQAQAALPPAQEAAAQRRQEETRFAEQTGAMVRPGEVSRRAAQAEAGPRGGTIAPTPFMGPPAPVETPRPLVPPVRPDPVPDDIPMTPEEIRAQALWNKGEHPSQIEFRERQRRTAQRPTRVEPPTREAPAGPEFIVPPRVQEMITAREGAGTVVERAALEQAKLGYETEAAKPLSRMALAARGKQTREIKKEARAEKIENVRLQMEIQSHNIKLSESALAMADKGRQSKLKVAQVVSSYIPEYEKGKLKKVPMILPMPYQIEEGPLRGMWDIKFKEMTADSWKRQMAGKGMKINPDKGTVTPTSKLDYPTLRLQRKQGSITGKDFSRGLATVKDVRAAIAALTRTKDPYAFPSGKKTKAVDHLKAILKHEPESVEWNEAAKTATGFINPESTTAAKGVTSPAQVAAAETKAAAEAKAAADKEAKAKIAATAKREGQEGKLSTMRLEQKKMVEARDEKARKAARRIKKVPVLGYTMDVNIGDYEGLFRKGPGPAPVKLPKKDIAKWKRDNPKLNKAYRKWKVRETVYKAYKGALQRDRAPERLEKELRRRYKKTHKQGYDQFLKGGGFPDVTRGNPANTGRAALAAIGGTPEPVREWANIQRQDWSKAKKQRVFDNLAKTRGWVTGPGQAGRLLG